ncbi:MAG: RNA polymerase sigma factor [Gaiellaceae bacterium]
MPPPPSGGASALEQPLTQYESQIQRHVRAMVRDADLAEELTQETFLRALAARSSLRDSGAMLGWLYRIATNVSLDHLRRRELPLEPTPLPEEELDLAASKGRAPSSVEAKLERAEMSECVQDYLAALSDDQRVALLLHDVHGLSNPEVAELVGCSLASAKIRVHRARKRMRELLAEGCAFSHDERGALVCDPKGP